MANFDYNLFLRSLNNKELFKNSVRKKYFKKLHKGKFLASSPLFRRAASKFVYKSSHYNVSLVLETIFELRQF